METETPEPKQTVTTLTPFDPKWSFRNEKTKKQDTFPEDESILIEKEYQAFLKGGPSQFQIGYFLLDLKEKKAVSSASKKRKYKLIRLIRGVHYELSGKDHSELIVPIKGNTHFDATPFLSQLPVAYFFRSVKKYTEWYPYSEEDNIVTETNYQLYLKDQEDKNYEINPERSVNFFHGYQFPTAHNTKKRAICRVVYGWFWSKSYEVWELYPPEQQNVIETAYCNNEERVFLQLGQGKYLLNFVEMAQFNCSNYHKRRDIIRVGPKLNRDKIVVRPENVPNGKILCIKKNAYPDYWESFQVFKAVQISEKSKMYQTIQRRMNSTIVRHTSGLGFVPGQKRPATSYRILKILQIQSETLWERYIIKKEKIFAKFGENYKNSEIYRHLKKFQLSMLDETVNETFLFHGTSKVVADLIAEFGFDCRQGAEIVTGRASTSMFGNGYYFAENSSKSNQYIPCPVCGGNSVGKRDHCLDSAEDILGAGGYTMILARVLLGDAQLCLKYEEKDYKGKEVAPLKEDGTSYDSIFAEKKAFGGNVLNYREFVVFDRWQIYPEFLIYFMRM